MAEISRYNKRVLTPFSQKTVKQTSTETQAAPTETNTTTTTSAGTGNAPTKKTGPDIRYEYVYRNGHYEQIPTGTYAATGTPTPPEVTPTTAPTPTNPTTTTAAGGPTHTYEPCSEELERGRELNPSGNFPTTTGETIQSDDNDMIFTINGKPVSYDEWLAYNTNPDNFPTPTGGTTPSGPSPDDPCYEDWYNAYGPSSTEDVTSSPTSSYSGQYIVQSGDNLWDICKKITGYTNPSDIAEWVDEVVELNNLKNGGYLIHPGQTLSLP